MAELAAGAVIAEELISTTVYTGIAAYAITQPTMPLKATFSQIATTASEDPSLSLSRSHHTVTVVKDKAYIFGGRTSPKTLAGNEVHAVSLLSQPDAEKKAVSQYAVIPALETAKLDDKESTGSTVPQARFNHAACQLNISVAIFGGQDESEKAIEEGGALWLFNTANQAWDRVRPKSTPPSRTNATLCPHGNGLILYGGQSSSGKELQDVWHFDYAAQSWNQRPNAPITSAKAVVASEVLYLLDFPSNLSAELHALSLTESANAEATWTLHTVPTNPLTSKLAGREGALAIPLQFGHGRNFLLYFLGRDHSDAWTLQLPAATPSIGAPKKAGAIIKDTIRSAVGANTGALEASEIEIVIPQGLDDAPPGAAGKLHPGPRSWTAADVMSDGHTVILWGGISRVSAEGAEETTEGDGWMIRFT